MAQEHPTVKRRGRFTRLTANEANEGVWGCGLTPRPAWPYPFNRQMAKFSTLAKLTQAR